MTKNLIQTIPHIELCDCGAQATTTFDRLPVCEGCWECYEEMADQRRHESWG